MTTAIPSKLEVLRVSDYDELRTVTLTPEDDGAFLLCERTDGALTYQTFGALSHVRYAHIAPAETARLCSSLDEIDPLEALSRFFSHGGIFLSDLLDHMDACGIIYTVAISTPTSTLMRTSRPA